MLPNNTSKNCDILTKNGSRKLPDIFIIQPYRFECYYLKILFSPTELLCFDEEPTLKKALKNDKVITE